MPRISFTGLGCEVSRYRGIGVWGGGDAPKSLCPSTKSHRAADGDDLGEERLVGGRKRVVNQIRRVDPSRVLTFDVLRLAFNVLAEERMKPNMNSGVDVLDRRQPPDRTHVDGELLKEFAGETLLERFPGFALAAGKLPIAPQGVVGLTLADEDLSATQDNRDGGVDLFQ